MTIARAAIRRPVTVAMAFVGLLLVGLGAASRIGLEEYPAVPGSNFRLLVPYPSASAQEVERNVTRPVEEVLATLGGIDRMQSSTEANHAFVLLTLEAEEDPIAKSIEAKELVESMRHRLPEDVRHVQLNAFNQSDEPILSFIIAAPSQRPEDTWRLLDERVRPVVERVQGVSGARLFGAHPRYIRIALRPGRLEAHGLDVLDIERRLRNENFHVSAGTFDGARLETWIRPMGRFKGIEDILDLPLRPNLRLADVADVAYATLDEGQRRRLNGETAIGLAVHKRSDANLVAVAEAAQRAMAVAVESAELDSVSFLTIDNSAESVIDALERLIRNGAVGALLSIIVLFAFIRRLIPTVMVAAAIPLAMVVALGVTYLAGLTLNTMSLVALMVAVGLLVDNSVVVTEAIALKQRQPGLTPFEAADQGVTEVGLAITAGTVTTAIVFLPVFWGMEQAGTALLNIGVPLVTAIGTSLLIATTLIPTAQARLPAIRQAPRHRLFQRLASRYERLLRRTLRHKTAALVGATLLAGAGVYGYGQVGVNMFPSADLQFVEVQIRPRNVLALERMEAIVDVLEGRLLARRDEMRIASVSTSFDSQRASLRVALQAGQSASKVSDAVRELLPGAPDVDFHIPSREGGTRRRSGGMGVRLIGDSTAELLRIAEDVIGRLKGLPMLTNVHTESGSERREIVITLNPEQAGELGVTAESLARSVSVALEGVQLRRGLEQGGREDDIRMETFDSQGARMEDLRRLPIFLPDGGTVALEAVAELAVHPALTRVQRENRETTLTVAFSLKGATPRTAQQQIEAALQGIEMPPGYRWSLGRDFDSESDAFLEMAILVGLAVVLVYMVMAALFESLLFPTAVLSTILYAGVGALLLLWATDTPLTMMAMTGVILLAGIVVNNAIVLLNRALQLTRAGRPREEAIVQAGRERLRPIILTAATTIVGLAPLALAGARADELGPDYAPMARAVIGGLTVATAVTLLLTPVLYLHLDNLRIGTLRFWRDATAA